MGDFLTMGSGPSAWLWSLPDRDTVTIGRDPACDLCLPSDDQVSRRHAELHRSGGGWSITDRSTNGSYLNGARISQQPLSDGDRIRLGANEFTFHTGERRQTAPEPPTQPQPQRPPRGLANKMVIAGALEVLHLGLNSLLTFVTDFAAGPARWIIGQTAVIVTTMVMTGASAIAERRPAAAPSGDGTPAPQRSSRSGRSGRSTLVVAMVFVIVLGVGGFAVTRGVRYVVNYTTGKESGPDRLVSQVVRNSPGLILTVEKVEDTPHFTRVELTVKNNTAATSITLPLFQNSVFSAADGTTLQADEFRSQWSQTVPPGAFQRGTITFPGHLANTPIRASLSFSHVFGTFGATAISVAGIRLKPI